MKKLPNDAVTQALSKPTWRASRAVRTDDYRWHVSDLINTYPERAFCPREKVLQHFDTNPPMPSKTTPAMQMLFDVGNFYHDSTRDAFIASEPYGKYVYGNWLCPHCAERILEATYEAAKFARVCKCPVGLMYEEVDLYDEEYRVVGHPDLLVLYDGIFYIYEIKTIDRADIDFKELSAPLGDHALQGSTYYYLMKRMKRRTNKYIRFIYIDRSTSTLFSKTNLKEFTSIRQPYERLTSFMREAAVANAGIESRKLPKRICAGPRDRRAQNCKCATDCFAKRYINV